MLMVREFTKKRPLEKKPVDIESLLVWAYRQELPKRQLSAAESIWRDMSVSGPFGPVDDYGVSIQRYAGFGFPHRDAIAIDRAVCELPNIMIDWQESLDAIMGHLSAMVTINDLHRQPELQTRITQSSWPSRSYNKLQKREQSINRPHGPRDLLLIGTINTTAIVQSHARQGTQPEWFAQHPVLKSAGTRNGLPEIVGKSWGRDRYSIGAYCPLVCIPSPIRIAQCRANYIAWWRGLTLLAESLELDEHVALPPTAPQLPWLDEPQRQPVTISLPAAKMPKLPLKPARPLAGPPRQQSQDTRKRSQVRRKFS